MNFRRGVSCFSAAVLLTFATPVMAQDENTVSGADWTGFWAGIAVGGGNTVYDAPEERTSRGEKYRTQFNPFSSEGGGDLFGSIGVGYDRRVSDRFVAGAFTDFDISRLKTRQNYAPGWMDDRNDYISDGYLVANESTNLEHKYSWNVGGRLGVLVRERSMIYGLLAYTRGEFNLDYGFNGTLTNTLTAPPAVSTNPARTQTFHGLTLGAGFEHMLAPNLVIRGEYRFTNFGKQTIGSRSDILVNGFVGYTNTVSAETLDPTMHTGRVSIAYKFNFDDR